MANEKKLDPVTFEGCRIVFRNFAGAAGTYNYEGDRNFNLLLDDDTAEAMLKDGWNVKYLKPREPGDKPQARIEVSVSYNPKARPPNVVMITSRGRTKLDESNIMLLDWAEFENVDLILNPYKWEVSGRTGIKAYLQTMFVTIREDALELKYADVPDAPDSAKSSLTADATQNQEPPF
jgi:hypothetical protein